MNPNPMMESRIITPTGRMKESKIGCEMVSLDFHDRKQMCARARLRLRLFACLMVAISFGGYGEMSCAANPARGRLLYETNCGECHTKSVSGRSNRVAKSVSDIRKWVIQWEGYKGYRWSDEDVEDVTQYLNNRFYKYKNLPGAANDR